MGRKIKVVVSVGHMGKPDKPLSRGACFHNVYEADLALEYARVIFQQLTIAGHSAFLVTHGSYNERAAFSNRIKADLYLSCHYNSSHEPPTNPYSLVEISEYAGHTTKKIAEKIRQSFFERLPVKDSKTEIIECGGRGWVCIGKVGSASAILLEPLFINKIDGLRMAMESPLLIGSAVSDIIINYNWG